MRRALEIISLTVGVFLIPLVWAALKVSHTVSDRLLPSPSAVLFAYRDISPNILIHCLSTATRLAVGFCVGVGLGVFLGIAANSGRVLGSLLLPSLQALRAVPATAAVPFFLLWFGFSETGRLLLVVGAVATNVAIASAQILARVPEKYQVFFRGFRCDGRRLIWRYAVPIVASNILPTLRFALALVIGAQVVSELLGAQVGLGYVLQNARSTFSLPALFLAMILLGLMTAGFDALICWLWRWLVYWERI
jgi:ABC-type nitrate/sulfonate/bicarbonate transport system permease component